MKILITGGTGFIGGTLCNKLQKNGHHLTVLSRRPEQVPSLCGETVAAVNDLDKLDAEMPFDAIINLAGEGIAEARWTPKRKQILLDSRIKTTGQLIRFIEKAKKKPEVLISGSAIGFYGDKGNAALDENSLPYDDFSHRLCAKWEETACEAETYGVRVCIVRTGLVIGKKGGFLKRMLLPFQLGLGGRLGDGGQWMSWIHRDDYIKILELLLNSPTLQGTFNATAPNPVTNDQFTRCLAKTLHRPAFIPVPAFVLNILLGELAELLLGGQRVFPKRIKDAGFEFTFETLEQALQDVL